MAFDIRPSFIRAAAWLGLWGVCLGWLALKAPGRRVDTNQQPEWGLVALGSCNRGWIGPGCRRMGTQPKRGFERLHRIIPQRLKMCSKAWLVAVLFLGGEDEETLKFERFLRFDTFTPFDDSEDWSSLRASLLPNITILDGTVFSQQFRSL